MACEDTLIARQQRVINYLDDGDYGEEPELTGCIADAKVVLGYLREQQATIDALRAGLESQPPHSSAVTRLIQETSTDRNHIVGVWDVRSLGADKLARLRYEHEPEFVYARAYDALEARLREAEAQLAQMTADLKHVRALVSRHETHHHELHAAVERQHDQAVEATGRALRAESREATLREALVALADDYHLLCGDGVTADTETDVLKQARAALQAVSRGV